MKNLFSIGFEKYSIDNLNNDELVKHCQDTYTPTNKTTNFDNEVLNLLKSIFLSQGQSMVKKRPRLQTSRIPSDVNRRRALSQQVFVLRKFYD